MYTYPSLFLRIRGAVFSTCCHEPQAFIDHSKGCIAFISFLWTILLSFYVFYQWEILGNAERE